MTTKPHSNENEPISDISAQNTENVSRPHSNEEKLSLKQDFIRRFCGNGGNRWLRGIFWDEKEKLQTVLTELDKADALLAQKDADMLQRVGMLRQWLNEDRITDAKRMVTNAELLVWLTPPDQTDKYTGLPENSIGDGTNDT